MAAFGVDARPLQGETKYRGIGKSLENIVLALRKVDKTNSYIYYLDLVEPIPIVLKSLQKNESIKFVNSQKVRRARYIRSFMKSFKSIRPNPADIAAFLQPDVSLGIPSSVPTAVIFYDLIPLLFREQEKEQAKKSLQKHKSMLANEVYWAKYKNDLKRYKKAKSILSISLASKNDLIKYFPEIDTAKVKIFHLGVKSLATKVTKHNLTDQYLLYVGGIDYRKNVTRLLKDFFALKHEFSNLRLVLIGKEFRLKKQLSDMGWDEIMTQNDKWKDDVIIPGFVSDEELVGYYQKASVFVFPSIYEGFGLPVLEAMAMGTPVVAYATSSISEIAEDAALLANDGESLAPHIAKILSDDLLRKDLIKKGLARAKLFSWENTAKQLIKELESISND